MTEHQLVEAFSDPEWRLRNLYWIKDKAGKAVLFSPWPEQEKFYRDLWYRNVIPKARQRGFSTAVQLMILDACIFNPNTAGAVIAQDDATALQIFKNKIKFAWDRMPPLVREMFPPKVDNAHELGWEHDSSIIVATSTRGNTLQYLHVSEYGQICAKFPDRAAEIEEGSFPSVDMYGVIIVESTVESPFGQFSEMVKTADKNRQLGKRLAPQEYRLHFASWWDAPEYETDPDLITISPEDNAYFHRVEAAIGLPVSQRKRAWYVAKRDNEFGGANDKMWRQYPSTLEEAFAVSGEGLWLADQMASVRVQKRIVRDLPLLTGNPVNTFWDLGVTTDSNCCWLHQSNGPWDDFVGYFETYNEPYSAIVRQLQTDQGERGYVWGTHHLPHDGDQMRPGAESLKTPRMMFEELGLRNIEIVPRIADTTVGIDQLREDFATYRFDEVRCADGIKHLDGFSKVWNNTMSLWSPIILKNGHQHAADALRQKAQWAHNMRIPTTKRLKRTAVQRRNA